MNLTTEQKRAALKGVDILDADQVFDAVAVAIRAPGQQGNGDFHFSQSAPVSAPSIDIETLRKERDDLLLALQEVRAAAKAVTDWADPKGCLIGHDIANEAVINLRNLLADSPAAANAGGQEPERMTIDQSKEYLVKFMEQYFTDKTFHRYIRGEKSGNNLASDFAWQMARALRMIEHRPTATASARQDEDLTYVIVHRPGRVPDRKGGFSNNKLVENMLRELYEIYPDCICDVITMPRDCYPESGREWIAMYGDKRRKPLPPYRPTACSAGDVQPVATCGDNPVLPARIVGCGHPIGDTAALYRCTHCDVPFHKECANKHFEDANVLTEEMIDSMTPEEVERASAALAPARPTAKGAGGQP